ncbi:ectonucleotide pyrophosphatase/phosphodiesterase family member 5 isoform X1 [Halyomorpha halys]|uniref:ectonucleotide pyrophosphatase/phosphodiesterase family member 5 isoform X1 n=2 Tax=Halyomorpha halys TaxID=286706 RepID=UPI0006D52414|nr:ectonucleotide pyrophosphatase/phosphodiesterase family member 5 isoform X1 [Halyomorpha halys]
MNHLFILIFFSFFLFISCFIHHDKLLVISYDGFRYDYLDLNITPNLNSLKNNSSYAKCLLNVFPTQTFVNHFSIATGLYAEVHGVLGSNVFDQKNNKLLKYSYELFHYNENIIPIWTLNELAGKGRHSGVMMWPGSNFAYNGTNATFMVKYNSSVPWDHRVTTALKWFVHPETPANLVMMYFEEPDSESHAFGPGSPEVLEQIRRTDNITKYILDSLANNNLSDVNIIFLSDHGMEAVTRDRIIDLRQSVGEKADMYGTSPVCQIYPKPGQTVSEIYKLLMNEASKSKNFKVYLKSEIPEHLHIKFCERTPPILAVAEPQYAFQDIYSTIDWEIKNKHAHENGTYGVHGYDPETVTMHPYFIAHGPLFKRNHSMGELRTVDMFSLFSHILRLGPPPVKPNGTFSGVEDLFTSSASEIVFAHVYIISVFLIAIIAISVVAICYTKKRNNLSRKERDHLEEMEIEMLLEVQA